MRILMIAACPFPGNRGTPSRILKMSEALIRQGYDVDVLAYNNRDFEIENKELGIYRISSVPFYTDNSPGPKILKPVADFLLILKGMRLLSNKKYDFIHAHHIEGGICGVVLKSLYKIPLIYDSHVIVESEIKSFRKYNFLLISKILKKIESICYQNALGIVYVAKETEDYAIRYLGVDKKKGLILPTGTNISEILSLQKNLKNPFYKLNGKNIVYTGSITKYQNVEDILEVAKKFKSLDLNFFIVTGQKENDGKDLIEKINSYNLDRVYLIFDASFKNQMTYANFADVLLSPRHFLGGIPQKITNYAALKRKIVASHGSVKILDNNSAYIYNGGDIDKFKSKILEALRDKTNLKEKNAFKIVKKFDWDYLIKKLDNFYNSLLERTK